MTSNIYLTGFSGTGKSRVGQAVARVLGWLSVDTDDRIARDAGKPIAAIFREDGEPAFRDRERVLVREAADGDRQVVATGGGTFVESDNAGLMLQSGVIVCLEARSETIYRRLQDQEGGSSSPGGRPLLHSRDPLKRIRTLKAKRQAAYARAHWTVHTDGLSIEQVAREVVRGWRVVSGQGTDDDETRTAFSGDPDLAATVEASSGSYPVLVGWGLLPRLGELLSRGGISGPVYLITDDRVFDSHGRVAQVALHQGGIAADTFILPAGEQSKSLDMAQRLYEWLSERRARRGHTLVAMGGGVVGDLTGFVAATYNRGMGFVQVPTSLAAMVDASIGGKTAVNLPSGKNLVGAFHQPRLVVADVAALRTLPKRAIMEGWAEAIKHGLILDSALFDDFERHADAVLALEAEATTGIIRRSVAIKASVVSEDERETTGYRNLLNYGHTIGHGLEAATEYGRLLHGEAVAVGMMGAARIGQRLGLTPPETVERQEALLRRFDLPLRCPEADLERVSDAMALDKKAEGKALRWVLLEGIGHAVVSSDVPDTLVQEVLRDLLHP